MVEDGKGRVEKTPDLNIIERFLNVLWESRKELKRTQLHMAVGMNYRRCSVYINILVKAGLITIKADERGRDIIRITESGVNVHHALSECIELFKKAR